MYILVRILKNESLVIIPVFSYVGKAEVFDHIAEVFLIFKARDTIRWKFTENVFFGCSFAIYGLFL